MKKIIILFSLISFIIISGCDSNISNEIKNVNKETIEKIVEKKEYIILDVRTKEEYNEEHVKHSINIPYNEITESIKLDKNKIIFVYCKSGNRSEMAYNALSNMGYEVYNLGAYNNINLEKER